MQDPANQHVPDAQKLGGTCSNPYPGGHSAVPGIHYLKNILLSGKQKALTLLHKSTRFIFCFVVFDGFVFVSGSRNFVSPDFVFPNFAISFGTGAVLKCTFQFSINFVFSIN